MINDKRRYNLKATKIFIFPSGALDRLATATSKSHNRWRWDNRHDRLQMYKLNNWTTGSHE